MNRSGSVSGNAIVTGLFALLFELVGTIFLTYTISASGNNPTAVILVLILFNLIGYRISAAHFNPAITFAALFRRHSGRFEKKIAILYILFQCAGAFAGALFAWLEYGTVWRLAVAQGDKKIFQALLMEIIGTFTYVLIYMISTDKSTKLTQDHMLNSTVMAIGLGVSIIWGIGVSGGCFNPAIGLFLNLVKLFDTGRGEELKYVWIYLIFPFVGAFLSVIFHEFVFRNALEAKGEENEAKPNE